MKQERITIPEIIACKGKEPLVCLTAYTAPMARFLDEHVDILLVGDSLGMVLYGMDSTLGVTLDMMIAHAKAVVRSSKKALVVVDMPFGSYQENRVQAFRNAARILSETGAQGVKLEGGTEMEETIEYLVKRGIPVMGHIGLQPQSVHVMGGYVVQGKSKSSKDALLQNAKVVEKAGAFSIVLEGIIKKIADEITESIAIPTIGIGASPNCDGQVLVSEDMLGLNANPPKFVKQYAQTEKTILSAVEQFARDVRSKKFPTEEHCYNKE